MPVSTEQATMVVNRPDQKVKVITIKAKFTPGPVAPYKPKGRKAK